MYLYVCINIYRCELMKEVAENRGVKLERNEYSVKFFV